MPKYIFPEKKETSEENTVVSAATDEDFRRHLYVPANKEVVESLVLGEETEVLLVGKVVGLEAREGTDFSRHEFELELTSVEAYPGNESESEEGNEFADLLEDGE